YILLFVAEEPDGAIGRDGGPGLLDLLLAHEHAAGENERLRTLACCRHSALDQQFVYPRFRGRHGRTAHSALCWSARHQRRWRAGCSDIHSIMHNGVENCLSTATVAGLRG